MQRWASKSFVLLSSYCFSSCSALAGENLVVRLNAMSTSTSFETMKLVWDKKSDGITVSLQPYFVTTKKNKSYDTDNDPVWRLERQLRKAQHERKASVKLTAEDLDVVYCDEHIVVVNKPSGVLTVPGLHDRSSILTLVREKYQDTILPDKQIVHRLDMDTSGLVVFGRTEEASKSLHQQFRDRTVHKEYECIVMGLVQAVSPSEEFLIDLPLQRDHAHPPFRRVSTPDSEAAARNVLEELHRRDMKKHWKLKNPQQSQSRGRVLEYLTDLDATRIRLEPITGRTHQLRVHCAALGYPIIGDPTYSLFGEGAPFGGIEDLEAVIRRDDAKDETLCRGASDCLQEEWIKKHKPNESPMCLHAALLEIDHPTTGKRLKWEIPPTF